MNKACMSFEKINDTIFKNLTNFSKIDENLGKNFGKRE